MNASMPQFWDTFKYHKLVVFVSERTFFTGNLGQENSHLLLYLYKDTC